MRTGYHLGRGVAAMQTPEPTQEWYYVGHYGQIGPLSEDQVIDLVRDGVIERDTYVWRTGLTDWRKAESVSELLSTFARTAPPAGPPPMPGLGSMSVPPTQPGPAPRPPAPSLPAPVQPSPLNPYHYDYSILPKSDKSKIAAGVLNVFLPGIGRMYLGYAAIGVLQIIATVATCGIGYMWPFIDGVLMMAGGVKLDGYGRRLDD